MKEDLKLHATVYTLFIIGILVLVFVYITQTSQVGNPNSFLAQVSSSITTTTKPKENGQCGSNSKSFPVTVGTSFPSSEFCKSGTPYPSNPIMPNQAEKYVVWTCKGKNGGTDDTSCKAKRTITMKQHLNTTWFGTKYDNVIPNNATGAFSNGKLLKSYVVNDSSGKPDDLYVSYPLDSAFSNHPESKVGNYKMELVRYNMKLTSNGKTITVPIIDHGDKYAGSLDISPGLVKYFTGSFRGLDSDSVTVDAELMPKVSFR